MSGSGKVDEHDAPLVLTGGARAAESLLLATLDPLLDEAAANPVALARPVVVVVPSSSLRRHLVSRVVAYRGRSVAGVAIVPVLTLAREIVERCGESVPHGAALFPVLVQRAARREGSLRAGLDALQDGYAPLTGTVRDLLDAGFEPALAEVLEERLREIAEDRRDREVERALAVVRVASSVHAAMDEAGIGTDAALLRRAAALLVADPERALPARAVFVFGFAEATGVTADLLEALVRHREARVVLDQPRDPAVPEVSDLGVAFTDRLRERFEGVAGRAVEVTVPGVAAGEIELVEAPGPFAEARAAAGRIRLLLDAGAASEGIGVVARDLGGFQHAIAQQFGRLAIPFSATGAPGLAGPITRRLVALLAVLAEGEEASLDAWLGARGGGAQEDTDLRLALRANGAGRLHDVAALDTQTLGEGTEGVPLPVRVGVATVEEEEGAVRVKPRRRIARWKLEKAVGEAAALCDALRRAPGSATAAHHLNWLRELIGARLGWRPEDPAAEAVAGAFETLARELPARERLEHEEFVGTVRDVLAEVGREPLGGAGGGVQVLGAMEARGATFVHLLVLGVNRDVFPRVSREDPLLPDRVRRALRVVLPDLLLKAASIDEERYLFAQLCSAGQRVTVSWQRSDDDGRPRPPSPLVERLRLARGAQAAQATDRPPTAKVPPLRPAHEHAVLVGVAGRRRDFARVLELALAPRADATALAAARLAALDEIDPDLRSPEGRTRARMPGPYQGLVGSLREEGEARSGLHITRLEGVALCGWRVFLERLLGIEPTPDPAAELPAITPLLLGDLVHAALERIVREAAPDRPRELAGALAAVPVTVAWPAPERLDEMLSAEAARIVRDAGLGLPGLATLLALLARPYLEVVERLEWTAGAGGGAVLGVEVRGELSLRDGEGKEWRVGFRADRVDREPSGSLVRLTDYKIAKPPYDFRLEETRRAHLLDDIATGRRLQAVAYALGSPGPAEGRYLFLGPAEREEIERVVTVGADDETAGCFASAAAAVLDAWRTGAFVPRVLDRKGDTPRLCQYCEVRQACLVDDSGARRRLVEWLGSQDDSAVPALAAARRLWALGTPAGEGEE